MVNLKTFPYGRTKQNVIFCNFAIFFLHQISSSYTKLINSLNYPIIIDFELDSFLIGNETSFRLEDPHPMYCFKILLNKLISFIL